MNLPTKDKNRQKAACGFARAIRIEREGKDTTEAQNGAEVKKSGKMAGRGRGINSGVFLPCAVMLLSVTSWAAMGIAATREPETINAEPMQQITAAAPVIVADKVVVEETPAEGPAEAVALYTREELEMLALVIYQEAGGDACSDETRQMVGEVVLNRVADERFPDTIEDVLLAKGQYGRLYWTGLVWPERAELPQEAHAVARAYDCAGKLLSGTVERLLPVDVIWQSENVQGTEIVAQQDGFYFCR